MAKQPKPDETSAPVETTVEPTETKKLPEAKPAEPQEAPAPAQPKKEETIYGLTIRSF